MNHQPNISCFLKTGFQGGQGAGKSWSAGYLSLGISVEQCNRAPVLVWDSEPSWQFIKPRFDAEKVPLIHIADRSFKSLKASLAQARREGCCVHVADQLAAPWRDLLRSFSDDSGFIGMTRQNQLRSQWDEFVEEWKDLPMHSIACGRLGWEFIDYEEDGHMKFAKGDSKMKAGGGESFGYEPYLTCEFTRLQETEMEKRRRKKRMRHVCTVLKDQTSILNGQEFIFKDLVGYKPGDYKFTFREFKPHLEFLAQVSGVNMNRGDSKELVHTESHWQRTDSERTALLEEWDATMESIAGGRSREAETIRRIVGEAITSERSRTRFEKRPLEFIAQCRTLLLRFEERYLDEKPGSEKDILKLVELTKKEMQHIAPAGSFDRSRGVEQFHEKPAETTVLAETLKESIALVGRRKKVMEPAETVPF